jgi:hypothetical protein
MFIDFSNFSDKRPISFRAVTNGLSLSGLLSLLMFITSSTDTFLLSSSISRYVLVETLTKNNVRTKKNILKSFNVNDSGWSFQPYPEFLLKDVRF